MAKSEQTNQESENNTRGNRLRNLTASWRPRATAWRQHHSSFAGRLGLAVLALLVAAAAGFAGGRLADHNSDVNISGNLSGQKRIVTSQGQLYNQIARQVGPSVVSVNVVTTGTTDNPFFGPQSTQEQAAGTGIIISKEGVILTNRHVVPAGTTEVSVTLSDGTKFDHVKVLGRTSQSDSLDVAFLKIEDLGGHQLHPATIGDSAKSQIGDPVVAIGNALGQFQNTVTAGIISGFGRQVVAGSSASSSTENLGDLIQTDAAINEGNSGGPLVNMSGQVIGLNTAIASGAENIGFAIPINDIKGLVQQVLTTGSFARPYLGVRYLSLTPAIAKQYAVPVDHGAYIVPSGISGQSAVLSGSPADKAGLKAGDVITKLDDTDVNSKQSLTTLLNKHQPGDNVRLTVQRNGKTLHITVTLGSMPSDS